MHTRVWAVATVAGMLLVVLVFIAATLSVHQRFDSTEQAISLAENGVPSVRLLGQARGDLRSLRQAARALESGPSPAAQAELQRAQQALIARLDEEQRTPLYPGEEASSAAVNATLARLAEETARLARGGDQATAHVVQRTADTLDRELEVQHDVNSASLQHDGAALLNDQRARLGFALLLDMVGLMVAVLVTGGLVVLVRRQLAVEKERRLALEERAAELDAFSSRVAHDLMSPLATVSLALTATEQRPDPRLNQRAARALTNARSIVTDVLAFARSGGRPSDGARCSVPETVRGVVDEMQPLACSQRIDLDLGDVDGGEVACESGILATLLTNLISNAIKFMDEKNERRIRVRARALSSRVRFEVEDTCGGLPHGFESLAFDPYRRARTNVPGLGLGLATVKRLAEAHHGAVGVVSRAGTGATFWFELPRPMAVAGVLMPAPQPA